MTDRGAARELTRLETLDRNGSEEIRWSLDEYSPVRGEPSTYIHARKWFLGTDGQWHPTKAGVTIRLGEIDRVVAALQIVQRARLKNEEHPDAD